jgi:macrolide-specific efflux system membrane fusion protein
MNENYCLNKPYPRSSYFFTTLVLIVLGWAVLTSCSVKNQNQFPTPTPIPTVVIPAKPIYVVQRGEIINQIDINGRVIPVVQQDLVFQVAGRVNHIFVKIGDKVTQGQLLADLDAGPTEFDMRRAKVNLAIARLNLDLVKVQPPIQSEVYSLTVAIKERELELAQITLDEMNNAVESGQIISPLNGEVLSIILAEGSAAEAYKPAIVIADLSNLEISAELTDQQLAMLAVDMRVAIYPGVAIQTGGSSVTPIVGWIRTLPYPYGKGGDASGQAGKIVRIAMDVNPGSEDYSLGDLVHLTILIEKKENVLWLPPQAIRNFEGRRFVIVQEDAAQRRVDIKVGIEVSDRVEIISGLNEGEMVIAP